jgi:hypothetical protein
MTRGPVEVTASDQDNRVALATGKLLLIDKGGAAPNSRSGAAREQHALIGAWPPAATCCGRPPSGPRWSPERPGRRLLPWVWDEPGDRSAHHGPSPAGLGRHDGARLAVPARTLTNRVSMRKKVASLERSGVPNVVWMGTTHARGNGEKLWQKLYPVQLLGSLHLDSSQYLPLMRTLRKPLASAKAKALLPINAVAAMQSGDLAKAQIQKPRHSERCMSDIRLNR